LFEIQDRYCSFMHFDSQPRQMVPGSIQASLELRRSHQQAAVAQAVDPGPGEILFRIKIGLNAGAWIDDLICPTDVGMGFAGLESRAGRGQQKRQVFRPADFYGHTSEQKRCRDLLHSV
jgi:hypothetical protein